MMIVCCLLVACGNPAKNSTEDEKETTENGSTQDNTSNNKDETESMSENKTYEIVMEDLVIKKGDKEIYGKIYRPKEEGVYPAVILSHGYNGSHADFSTDSRFLARNGYIAYAFDFCGGSTKSKSSGVSTEMTIFTEKEDLLAVIDYFKEIPSVNKEKLFLFGGSQGGLVSALAAEERKEDIAAMALYFPAFNIPDDWRRNYASEKDIPEVVDFWGLKLGKVFFTAMREFQTFENIGGFDKEILIIHGDKDAIVSMSYVERAQKHYKNASLVVLEGEGHGFSPQGGKKAREMVFEFLKEQ